MLDQKYNTINNSKNEVDTSDVDEKFDTLYKRIEEMAHNQANFNSMMKESIKELDKPVEKQLKNMTKESELILKELERAQGNNREILGALGLLKTTPNSLQQTEANSVNNFYPKHKKMNMTTTSHMYSTPVQLKKLSFGKPAPIHSSSQSRKPKSFQLKNYLPLTKRHQNASPLPHGHLPRYSVEHHLPLKQDTPHSFYHSEHQ